MDSNLSDLIGGVLSNPEMLNKVMTLMPIVTQMMNSDSSDNNPPQQVAQSNQVAQPAPVSQDKTPETLMANENVAAALKNLISALYSANSAPIQTQIVEPEPVGTVETTAANDTPQPNDTILTSANNANNIEKTLDTLKNISSATSPDSDHRAKLLLALKPFLKDGRQTKVDTAIKYINAAKLFTMFGKNGFV